MNYNNTYMEGLKRTASFKPSKDYVDFKKRSNILRVSLLVLFLIFLRIIALA